MQVIIDSHAHLVAPASLYAHRSNLIDIFEHNARRLFKRLDI